MKHLEKLLLASFVYMICATPLYALVSINENNIFYENQKTNNSESSASNDSYMCSNFNGRINLYKNKQLIESEPIQSCSDHFVYVSSCPNNDFKAQDRIIKKAFICNSCDGSSCKGYTDINSKDGKKHADTLLLKGWGQSENTFYAPNLKGLVNANYIDINNNDIERDATLLPRFECVTDNGDGTMTGYFGYENKTNEIIYLNEINKKEKVKNKFEGKILKYTNLQSSLNPTYIMSEFLPNVHKGVIQIVFIKSDDNTVTWTLKNANEKEVKVTADINSRKCKNVTPIYKGMANDDVFKEAYAIFGYINENEFPIYYPYGINNKVNSSVSNNVDFFGQTQEFLPGSYEITDTLKIYPQDVFTGHGISWTLPNNEEGGFIEAKADFTKVYNLNSCSFANTKSVKNAFYNLLNNYVAKFNELFIYNTNGELKYVSKNEVFKNNDLNYFSFDKQILVFLNKLESQVKNATSLNCRENNDKCAKYSESYNVKSIKDALKDTHTFTKTMLLRAKSSCQALLLDEAKNSGIMASSPCKVFNQNLNRVTSELNEIYNNILTNIEIFNENIITSRSYCHNTITS